MSDSVELVAAVGGEVITYTPHGGAPKTFLAIVHRRPTQVQSGGRPYTAKVIEMDIPRDATDGVLSVKEGHDTVRFKVNLSDAQDTLFTVAKVISQDAGLVATDGGLFHVECHG